MNNIIANIRTQLQKLKCRIANLSNRVTYIEDNCCNSGDEGVQSIVPGDNITVDNTDPQNPIVSSTGGTTPTLAQVLAEGNNAGEEVIKFEYDDGLGIPQTGFIGFMDIPTGMGTQKELSFGTPSFRVTPYGFFNNYMGHILNFSTASELVEGNKFNTYYITSYDGLTRGLVGSEYYGAYYNDNTYVQKKYVDDAIDGIPTPNLTLEQARQNGNVLEGDIIFEPYSGNIISSEEGEGTHELIISNTDEALQLKSTRGIDIESRSGLNYNSFSVGVGAAVNLYSNISSFRGIIGNEEFDKQGDRKAFAQIADLQDGYIPLPTEGTAGQVLTTDGAGTYTWQDVPSGGSSLTLEQARQNGNVIDGEIIIRNISEDYLYTIDPNFDTDYNLYIGRKDILYGLSFINSYLVIYGDGNDFKGIVGNEEFDKQGDRKAFAQISDVEDAIEAATLEWSTEEW